MQLDNQPVDFTSFLADLENLSGLQAQQKGLRFVLEPSLPLPHKVISGWDPPAADPVESYQ